MAKIQHGRDLTGTEVANMLDELMKSIKAWAEAPHDARNGATVKICQKIVAETDDKHDRPLPRI